MEYEFIHDTITGSAKAVFTTEHAVIGPWLEVELGQNVEKLEKLLVALDSVEQGKEKEISFIGAEYSLLLTEQDVFVQSNASLSGEEILPEALSEEAIDFDDTHVGQCGLDDFRLMLLSWAKFSKL